MDLFTLAHQNDITWVFYYDIEEVDGLV